MKKENKYIYLKITFETKNYKEYLKIDQKYYYIKYARRELIPYFDNEKSDIIYEISDVELEEIPDYLIPFVEDKGYYNLDKINYYD